MNTLPALPVHPTKRHPLTGEPIQALFVRSNGHICWPIMGGAPAGGEGDNGGSGGGEGAGEGNGGGDTGSGSSGTGNATDEKGKDLGYPANTPVAEMTAEQQAAYWRNQSQKHEGRYKNLVGDRSFDDVRADLDAYAEHQRSQQTPAEQAITAAREAGRAEAIAEANSKAATAIFRASLQAQGHSEDDVDQLVANFAVTNFVKDGDVDTDALATFAKRFTPAGTAEERRRDFGGGHRREGGGKQRGAGGKAEAERRFNKTTAGA